MSKAWWKKAVAYQIYPKSFNDTTGNGTGDIQGIIEKLDYLKKLGVDVLWLTPIYKSPQRDNGYDISDYYSIHEAYGTMEDFESLLEQAHKRNIKIIMDIVINHTSTEHEWFKQAKSSKDNPYRDFYIWKDGKNGEPPTNWESKFGGSAWEYDETTEQYYLHLFDVTQADLNWENKKVRTALYEMMHFWLKKGVDGFRLDVINLISKDQHFPQDDSDGRKFYTDGPRIHEFLHEMNQQVFSKYNIMTAGEMSSTSIENCIRYTNPNQEELNMIFSFHHLKVDYPNGDKWTKADFDFQALKNIMSKWQIEMNEGGGWNALFWCNHDQPRAVSRFGNDQEFHKESAKMLATALHMMQGTPYIYQGEEFGMTNPNFNSINEYRDVESLNMFQILKNKGMKEQEIIEILKQKSRDNSRTPVQWNASENAGFTTGTPWIETASNYQEINAEKSLKDADSVFYHYQKLIQLRKEYDVITDGDFQLIMEQDPELFAYIRTSGSEKLIVINNFYGKDKRFTLPSDLNLDDHHSEMLLSNYQDSPALSTKEMMLRPYESIVYHLKKMIGDVMMTNKYLTIYNSIVEQIKNGELPPQTLLPSENELKDQYETSRETIRKALNLLSQNGYIQKVRGKGSIVIDISKFDFPVSGLVSFKELASKMGNEPTTIVNELSFMKPDDYIRQQLQLGSKDMVWKVVRTREINGEKIILDKDYLCSNIVPTLTEEICADSIYQYLENELNLSISFAKKEIVVVEPNNEDRSLLDLEGFHNVVVIKNYVYLDDATLFQYTESRHRPDKFRFVDFARR